MKKIKWIITFFSLSVLIGMSVIYFTRDSVVEINISEDEVRDAYKTLSESLVNNRYTYFEFMEDVDVNYALENTNGKLINEPIIDDYGYDSDAISLGYSDKAIYEVEINEDGYYHFEIDYYVAEDVLTNLTMSVKVNGEYQYYETQIIDVPLRWKDGTKDFILDSYGDESLPPQERIVEWSKLQLYNNTYYTVQPLMFYLEKGTNTIEIENLSSNNLYLGDFYAVSPKKIEKYEEYAGANKNTDLKYRSFINAISYVEKNSSYIAMTALNTPSVTPNDPMQKKLNIIDGRAWEDAGQEIIYEIDVEETGNYEIALHYMNEKRDFSVFRTIKIDGEVPFEEMKAYEFETTGSNKWGNKILSNKEGEPYKFYLTKGKHTISLRAEYEPIARDIRNMQLVLDHINQFSLEIRKITGKDIDEDRTWKLTKYMPDTEKYLKSYEIMILSMLNDLQEYAPNGTASSSLSYLQKALFKIRRMMEKPDELPLYFEDLYSGTGSVSQMLGDSMILLSEQPLSLDGFYVYNNSKIDKPNASLIENIKNNFLTFTSTFISKKYVVKKEKDAVNIWVNRPITFIDTMQKLVDAEFVPSTGIKVKISVMPDVNKLVLATAANEQPDIALGLLSYMPYDLAIRNAAYDLTSFEDFWSYSENFAPGAFIPYVLNDGVYAIPETLEFHSLVYRKDIFDSLNLEVPDTWDDVIGLLPSLQRYGMNFYHPISGGGSLKWFYQTAPLMYQYGGTIYNKNGLTTAINTPESVKGLKLLGDLYTTYSLPEQVPLFYNSFRYNTLPVGIIDFNTYLQLKNAAPELTGKWALAPYPGVKQEDGTISRWYIANGRGGVILGDTDKAEESWEFLKWWLSTETQTKYGYLMQSTYGPEYVWLSGNINAVKNAPIEDVDKRVIIEQIKWLRDAPRTPGQYMVERSLSDIWNTVVFDGTSTRVAIDKQVITANREIRRKMIEFGYIDEDGNVLKPYVIRDIEWVKQQIEESKR